MDTRKLQGLNDEIPELLFAIMRYELFSAPLDKNVFLNLSENTLERLYALADQHDLAHWVGDALYQHGCLPKELAITKKYQQAQIVSLYRCANLSLERKKITAVLEDAQIPYVPLKGMLIVDYYPKSNLRTSSDTDILIHEEDLPRALQCLSDKLKYTQHEAYPHFHDISLFSPGGFHLELHFTLACGHDFLDTTLRKVWDHCTPVKDGSFEYRQSPEYFMFHQIAHMASHFLKGGCGIRPLADLQLLMKKMTYDEAILEALCREARLLPFYTHIKALSEVWFCGRAHDDVTRQMQSYIIWGGVYGTMDNNLAVQTQKKNKIGYIISRIFMPYQLLKTRYPVLKKHKWLYPIMTVRRWFGLLSPTTRHRATTELKKTSSLSDEKISKVAELLDVLELNE